MESSSEPVQICSFCKTRPATVRYTHVTTKEVTSELVCQPCFDRRAVQDALEGRILHIADLEDREQYDEALACLDEILEANRHRDHDQWLAQSIARDRAMILLDAGRYAEAEAAGKAWAELGFYNVGERWMHGSHTAETLGALGRPREGLAALEDALSHQEPRFLPGVLGYLVRLAELSEKLGQPVEPKWRSLAEQVAAWYGVEMPKHASLGEAIVDLDNAIEKAERMRRGEGEGDADKSDDGHDDES